MLSSQEDDGTRENGAQGAQTRHLVHALNGTWRAVPRAVAGCSICCLPKETTIGFHIRMMPMWDAEGVAFRPARGSAAQGSAPV